MSIGQDFEAIARRHRRELLAHAYRMLGSATEAEDAVQDALLRAWRSLDTLEQKERIRPWLYTIVIRRCLDILESRKNVRVLSMGEPSDPKAPPRPPILEPTWLEPLPDAARDPESRYVENERVQLAFVSALQTLPPRQRAVLLSIEVLGFSAAETGEQLEMTVAAVNSALQRARATLADRVNTESAVVPDDEATRTLLARYLGAWRALDLKRLVALLRQDAILTMPPSPTWISGREAIVSFYENLMAGARGHLRAELGRSNGQPALLVFKGDTLAALQVLTVEDGLVARIDVFTEPRVLAPFSSPA
jgi:RNA polymerase sigma-70 factor (ECF subfamily)